MCTKSHRPDSAYTLVEVLVASAVFSLIGLAVVSTFLFTARGYASLSNYAHLNQKNRESMDQITREIRQARKVTGYSSNATVRALTMLDGANQQVTWTFNKPQRALTLTRGGDTRTLLTNCNLLEFSLYMRPPTTNSDFDLYPVPPGTNWQETVKVIRLTWQTSMTIGPAANTTSEDIQTACVVIRKQQD